MTKYSLPSLPYDYAALEPHVSAEIMELHHDKHHRAYVDGANQTVQKLIEARSRDDFSQIAALQHALAFNVSGHILHSIFWRNLSPKGGGEPRGELGTAIDRDFGNFGALRKQMIQAAITTMGSGWGALVWEPASRRLAVTQIHDHQSEVTQGGMPLMVIDAWEHAYYLQYRNKKADFFAALFNVWNWDDIRDRYARASSSNLVIDVGVSDGAAATAPAPSPSAAR